MAIDNNSLYTSDMATTDLAIIIAQETSGISSAIPEKEDFDLAQLFVQIINSDVRQDPEFLQRILTLVV